MYLEDSTKDSDIEKAPGELPLSKLPSLPASSSLDLILIHYPEESSSCYEKQRLWKKIEFKSKMKRDYEIDPQNTGMIKSLLLQYQKDGEAEVGHILACTLAEKRIDENELRVELGLSAAETGSLQYHLGHNALETITGKKRGEISPLLDDIHLQKLDAVYFTRDLMQDFQQDKLYDLPLTLQWSVLINGKKLYSSLQERSSKYQTAPEFAGALPLQIAKEDWKIKEIDSEKAGYQYLFGGTIIQYQGQEYQITNPPLKKEGLDRKRKQTMCTAFPISRSDSTKVLYEYAERGKKRVFLPLTYEQLEQLLPP